MCGLDLYVSQKKSPLQVSSAICQVIKICPFIFDCAKIILVFREPWRSMALGPEHIWRFWICTIWSNFFQWSSGAGLQQLNVITWSLTRHPGRANCTGWRKAMIACLKVVLLEKSIAQDGGLSRPQACLNLWSTISEPWRPFPSALYPPTDTHHSHCYYYISRGEVSSLGVQGGSVEPGGKCAR